jgi:hypothetical protein
MHDASGCEDRFSRLGKGTSIYMTPLLLHVSTAVLPVSVFENHIPASHKRPESVSITAR